MATQAATPKVKLLTPRFRMSFPQLFTPKAFGDQEPTYGVTCLFEPGADLTNLQKAAGHAAIEKWGDKAVADFRAGKIRSPFRQQSEKDHLEGYEEGGIFIIARTKTKPGVVGPNVQPVTDPESAYPGRWARASLSVFAWSHPQGGRGVSFGLNNIQLLDDAPAFGAGRSKPSDDFEPVQVAANDNEEDIGNAAAAALFG